MLLTSNSVAAQVARLVSFTIPTMAAGSSPALAKAAVHGSEPARIDHYR